MSQKKLKFSQDVMHVILNLCQLAFNLKNDNDIEYLFGLTPTQFKEIIEKISGELPDFIFDLPEKKLEEIESIFAREFIFFQVQEKGSDIHYEEDLSKFSRIFSRDIKQQIAPDLQSKMKEE